MGNYTKEERAEIARTYMARYDAIQRAKKGIKPMAMLSKSDILGNRDHRRTQVIDTPEWGGSVIIIELSGKERDSWESGMVSVGAKGKQIVNMNNVRAKLCGRSIVDSDDYDLDIGENGIIISAKLKENHTPKRLFNDLEINDLGDTSAAALQRVFVAAQKLSGISDSDVEELVGDLKNVENSASGTV